MTGTTELAGLPVGGPASLPTVKVKLHIDPADVRDDTELDGVIDAVNALVRRWPVSEAAVGATEWPPHITEGAVMLAVRLFRRRNSPAGVEAFGQQGAAYVMRTDPDVAMLLRLGSYLSPGIG